MVFANFPATRAYLVFQCIRTKKISKMMQSKKQRKKTKKKAKQVKESRLRFRRKMRVEMESVLEGEKCDELNKNTMI